MEANAFLSDLPCIPINAAIIYMFYGLIIRPNCHMLKVRKSLRVIMRCQLAALMMAMLLYNLADGMEFAPCSGFMMM